MADSHAARWIIEFKDEEGKWVRSEGFRKPYFNEDEGKNALAQAQASGNGLTYRLRRK